MGLELDPKSEGTYYIFAGGTGIFPFLDLLDFILKKAIFTVANSLFGSSSQVFNPNDEDYLTTFDSGFKVVFFASFSNESEFIGFSFV